MFKIVGVLCGSASLLLHSQSVKFTVNSTESDGTVQKLGDDEERESIVEDVQIFVDEYLPKLRWAIETSSSILESLYLTWILRSILVQVAFFWSYLYFTGANQKL